MAPLYVIVGPNMYAFASRAFKHDMDALSWLNAETLKRSSAHLLSLADKVFSPVIAIVYKLMSSLLLLMSSLANHFD